MKKWFLDLYQEMCIDFLISRYAFFDIKNSIFLISKILILDINKSFLDIKKSNSWYQEILKINSKTAHKNTFLDIKKSISWYEEILSWYPETDFYYMKKCVNISWYQ